MAQYKIYTDTAIVQKVREGVRDTSFVLDRELTELGFDGVEDTDWENLQKVTPE